MDGKVLRGSRRGTDAARQVITVAGHDYDQILQQREVEAGDFVEVAIALRQEMPPSGRRRATMVRSIGWWPNG